MEYSWLIDRVPVRREGACTHLAKQLGVEICSVDARNILENGYLGDEKGEKKGRDVDRADW